MEDDLIRVSEELDEEKIKVNICLVIVNYYLELNLNHRKHNNEETNRGKRALLTGFHQTRKEIRLNNQDE